MGRQGSRRRTRVAEGIYKDRWGLAATVKVYGVQREIRFPPSTPLKTIRARRDQLRACLPAKLASTCSRALFFQVAIRFG